jgi:hypothetical protein
MKDLHLMLFLCTSASGRPNFVRDVNESRSISLYPRFQLSADRKKYMKIKESFKTRAKRELAVTW